jgi:inosine-uridine nucleoside N-ribohydrolase
MQKLIIDTDCGIDDAVAIMMALAHPDVEVIGIATVSGNVDVGQVTENVLRLLAYFDRSDIPVYHGASHALVQGAVRASGVHGDNGLGGVELPPTTVAPRPETAPVGLAELLRATPGATVVTLGPMTNLAMSLNLFPDAVSRIGRLVAMGGGIDVGNVTRIDVGNVTRFAEFNFYADPEAVQFVLDRGVPMEVIPWDACIEHEFSRDDLSAVGLREGRASELFFRLQDFVLARSQHVYGRPFTRHPDPLAMAYAIDPGVAAQIRRTGLTMELGNGTLRGASVRTDGEQVRAVMSIHRDAYVAILRRVGDL